MNSFLRINFATKNAMLKNLFILLAFIAALLLGIFIAKWWYQQPTEKTKTEAQVLLNQIQTVSKLVNTEGYFSEVYSEENTKSYYFFNSTKKIIIKVKAKVSAGYDLSGMKITTDETAKTIHISGIPEPSIISIEPDISYYDINNGIFNQFSNEDYTRLNKKAMDTIRTIALNSTLMTTVRTQGIKNFAALRTLAENMNWKIVFDDNKNIFMN